MPKKSLTLLITISLLITASTLIVSFFARGYRLSPSQTGLIKSTGLLSATSNPKSASVYVDDRLITATDDTINLPPSTYTIKIVKDGYLPWQKQITIKKEVVFQTNAQLFRAVPDLKPLTLTGAINPALSPNNSKIIYAVASASAAADNGLYQLDLTDRPLPLAKNLPKQLAPNYPKINWSQFHFEFSPDSQSVLASSPQANYLLKLDTPISRQLFDITPRLSLIQQQWQQQLSQIIHNKIKSLPPELQSVISTQSAETVSFSSADNLILYLAQADSQLKDSYITPPPAQSTQPQTRQIKKGFYYVYDIKQDTNFILGPAPNSNSKDSALQNPFWLPNSQNIIYTQDKKIKTIEYDGTNNQTIFAGDFDTNVVFPWSDGSSIVTLTSAYPGAPANLYAVSIR